MEPGEPVLLICNWFPPNAGIGGRRWAKFAKELARRGYPVHVIRSTGTPQNLHSLWTRDVQHPNIMHYPMPARHPAVMTRWPLTSLQDKLLYRFWLRVLPLLTKGNYYDLGCLSRKPMLKLATQQIQEHDIKHVIVTGAPFSLMAYAAELKMKFPQIHLTADFRDPWTWGKEYGFATIGPERLRHEKAQEALVVKVADRVIASTSSINDHLRSTYGGAPGRFITIPHALDPDDFTAPTRTNDGIYRMIYAGTWYSDQEAAQYVEQLLRSFESLRDKQPTLFAKTRFDLYVTDTGSDAFEEQIRIRGLQDQVRFHKAISPQAVLARIAEADLALVFLPESKKDIMVTKFNELFFVGCPILHVGATGVVSRTIAERRMGASIRVEELEVELPRIISGERRIEIDEKADHSPYLLAHLTDRLLNEVLDDPDAPDHAA